MSYRLFRIAFLVFLFGLAFSPQPAAASCCNIITTQACADCNFFMCNCSGKCDCQNSCDYNCNATFNTCLIYNQNPIALRTCSAMYSACEHRCQAKATNAVVLPQDPPQMSLVQDFSDDKPQCLEIFADFDTDGDASISRAEFVDLMARTQANLTTGDTLLDANGDGRVDAAENRAHAATYDALFADMTVSTHLTISRHRYGDPETIFDGLDTDGDGQLRWDEAGLPNAP